MDNIDKLIQALLMLDSETPVTYEAVSEYFKGKIVLTARQYYELDKKYRSMAFTVSGYTSMKVLQTFHDELVKAIDDGVSMNGFKQSMNDFLDRNGYSKLHHLQAENIFRTDVQTAYNAGAYEEMADPAVMAARPYWRYEAVNDGRARDEHLAMDGKVFPADSPVWDEWYPPNGYRCRCSVSSLSRREVEAQGLEVETEVPDPLPYDMRYVSPHPPQGFDHNPAKVRFTPDLTDVPETLRIAFERQQRGKQPASTH